jgi:peptidoglycan/LPS O-acetylase OafA/YrhL
MISGVTPNTKYKPVPSDKHYPALDGVRGFAVLAVMFHHFRFILEPVHRSQRFLLLLFDGGWCGVEIFFVLSGFLITGILMDTTNSSGFFKTFYARRFLRIFPLYFAYLAVVFLLLSRWWMAHFRFNPWAHVQAWPYLLYLDNFKVPTMFNDLFLGHLWSLAVEEQFYLVWPLVVAVLPRNLVGWTTIVLMAAAVADRLRFAGKSLEMSFLLNTSAWASLDSLAIGALAAILLRSASSLPGFQRTIKLLGLLSIGLFLVSCLRAGGTFLYYRPVHVWGVLALSISSACLVLHCATRPGSYLSKGFSLRPMRAFGRVSYGLYVWHPLVIAVLLPRIHPLAPGIPPLEQTCIKLLVMLVLAASTYAFAWLSWTLFENPILRFKKYFGYNRRPPEVLYTVVNEEQQIKKVVDLTI